MGGSRGVGVSPAGVAQDAGMIGAQQPAAASAAGGGGGGKGSPGGLVTRDSLGAVKTDAINKQDGLGVTGQDGGNDEELQELERVAEEEEEEEVDEGRASGESMIVRLDTGGYDDSSIMGGGGGGGGGDAGSRAGGGGMTDRSASGLSDSASQLHHPFASAVAPSPLSAGACSQEDVGTTGDCGDGGGEGDDGGSPGGGGGGVLPSAASIATVVQAVGPAMLRTKAASIISRSRHRRAQSVDVSRSECVWMFVCEGGGRVVCEQT